MALYVIESSSESWPRTYSRYSLDDDMSFPFLLNGSFRFCSEIFRLQNSSYPEEDPASVFSFQAKTLLTRLASP